MRDGFQSPAELGGGHIPIYPEGQYRRTSISGTTFGGKSCLSGTIFHAI
jgi:hypothetical protein